MFMLRSFRNGKMQGAELEFRKQRSSLPFIKLRNYCKVNPPSIKRLVPVTQRLASESRYTAA